MDLFMKYLGHWTFNCGKMSFHAVNGMFNLGQSIQGQFSVTVEV